MIDIITAAMICSLIGWWIGWVVSFEGLCSWHHFLFAPAAAIYLKLQEIKGLPCLIPKEKLLWDAGSNCWCPRGGSITLSVVLVIKFYLLLNTVIQMSSSLVFLKSAQLP